MKKSRRHTILQLGAAFLCLILIVGLSAQPAGAKKFDKAAAKKKVSVTYKKLSDGVLVIYKNKNNTTLKLTATMRFRDGDKNDISVEKQSNLCFGAKSTAAFFFAAPRDEYGNVVNYSSYKGSFSVARSKYTSRAKNITVSTELNAIEGTFAAVNTGNKTLSNIHATILFYDGAGNLLGCSPKYLNCFEKNSIDQFTVSYADRPWQPGKAKVYIDWAF